MVLFVSPLWSPIPAWGPGPALAQEEPATSGAAPAEQAPAGQTPAEQPPAGQAPDQAGPDEAGQGPSAPGGTEPSSENAATPPATAAESPFDLEQVARLARQRAAAPFTSPRSPSADFLQGISEADWNSLSFKDDRRLWRDRNLPFQVSFFHPGFIYNNVVHLNVVEDGRSRPLLFDPGQFNYPNAELAEKARQAGLSFAGFRLHFPFDEGNRKDEVASFLGATHFRAVARHSGYGLTARGLILNPATPEGEEFPYFRQFWLVRPEPGATQLTIYALLDAPSLTGAYCFVVKPGLSTVMDVSARLYPRAGAAWPKKIGLAPASSMYLYSEKENGSRFDYRPEVHGSDVLLYTAGLNNWTRRPLSNPERLEVNGFGLNNPRGFGLMQQDDKFDHYQDIAARFDRRPSLWIEPLGDWGEGRVELIEIPSTQDIHDNILAFWVPDSPPKPAAPEGVDPEAFTFAYRLYWMAPGVIPHQLGRAVATRMARSPKGESAQFLIDFESEELNAIPANMGLTSEVESGTEYPALDKRLIKNPVTGGWRLTFKVQVPQENGVVQSLISARGEQRTLRFRALLKKGENLPDSLTENWIYDLAY